jgi:hypothetical protein
MVQMRNDGANANGKINLSQDHRSGLNIAQREAVESQNDVVLIFAGPGV